MKEVIRVCEWASGDVVKAINVTTLKQIKADEIEHHVNTRIDKNNHYTYQCTILDDVFNRYINDDILIQF